MINGEKNAGIEYLVQSIMENDFFLMILKISLFFLFSLFIFVLILKFSPKIKGNKKTIESSEYKSGDFLESFAIGYITGSSLLGMIFGGSGLGGFWGGHIKQSRNHHREDSSWGSSFEED